MLSLLQPDDPFLRRPAKPVPANALPDTAFTALIADLFAVLDDSPEAVALAAPQVGVPWRIIVFDLGERGPRGHLINPVILGHSKHARPVTEGCLSYPGEFWRVRRYLRVDTTHVDKFGTRHTDEWTYFGAQMVQHEIEHLDGILLPDVAVRKVVPVPH